MSAREYVVVVGDAWVTWTGGLSREWPDARKSDKVQAERAARAYPDAHISAVQGTGSSGDPY